MKNFSLASSALLVAALAFVTNALWPNIVTIASQTRLDTSCLVPIVIALAFVTSGTLATMPLRQIFYSGDNVVMKIVVHVLIAIVLAGGWAMLAQFTVRDLTVMEFSSGAASLGYLLVEYLRAVDNDFIHS